MKLDERAFLAAMQREGKTFTRLEGKTPRAVAAELGIARKRADYLLAKWAGKGWYEWGSTIDLGLLRPEGEEAA